MDLQLLGKSGKSGFLSSLLVLTGIFLILASSNVNIPFLAIVGIATIFIGFVFGIVATYLAIKSDKS